jgi:hypothetical protein
MLQNVSIISVIAFLKIESRHDFNHADRRILESQGVRLIPKLRNFIKHRNSYVGSAIAAILNAGLFQVCEVVTACEVTVVPAYMIAELSVKTTATTVPFELGVIPVFAATVSLSPLVSAAIVISADAIVCVIRVTAATPAKFAGIAEQKTILIAPFLIAVNATSITFV